MVVVRVINRNKESEDLIMAKHGNKETLMITLYPDVKNMAIEQAESRSMSVSSYIERLILEHHYRNQTEENKETKK